MGYKENSLYFGLVCWGGGCMATATTLVPLEEYLRTSYEHDCDWVDGELRERGMPDTIHALVQQFFIFYFVALRARYGIRVYQETRIKVSARRYRIPDVLVMPAGAPFKLIPDTAPLLCVEVLSVDDSMSEMQEKIADYLGMGAGAVWVIDPRRRTLFVADATGQRQVEEFELGALQVTIAVGEIFEELDRETGQQ